MKRNRFLMLFLALVAHQSSEGIQKTSLIDGINSIRDTFNKGTSAVKLAGGGADALRASAQGGNPAPSLKSILKTEPGKRSGEKVSFAPEVLYSSKSLSNFITKQLEKIKDAIKKLMDEFEKWNVNRYLIKRDKLRVQGVKIEQQLKALVVDLAKSSEDNVADMLNKKKQLLRSLQTQFDSVMGNAEAITENALAKQAQLKSQIETIEKHLAGLRKTLADNEIGPIELQAPLKSIEDAEKKLQRFRRKVEEYDKFLDPDFSALPLRSTENSFNSTSFSGQSSGDKLPSSKSYDAGPFSMESGSFGKSVSLPKGSSSLKNSLPKTSDVRVFLTDSEFSKTTSSAAPSPSTSSKSMGRDTIISSKLSESLAPTDQKLARSKTEDFSKSKNILEMNSPERPSEFQPGELRSSSKIATTDFVKFNSNIGESKSSISRTTILDPDFSALPLRSPENSFSSTGFTVTSNSLPQKKFSSSDSLLSELPESNRFKSERITQIKNSLRSTSDVRVSLTDSEFRKTTSSAAPYSSTSSKSMGRDTTRSSRSSESLAPTDNNLLRSNTDILQNRGNILEMNSPERLAQFPPDELRSSSISSSGTTKTDVVKVEPNISESSSSIKKADGVANDLAKALEEAKALAIKIQTEAKDVKQQAKQLNEAVLSGQLDKANSSLDTEGVPISGEPFTELHDRARKLIEEKRVLRKQWEKYDQDYKANVEKIANLDEPLPILPENATQDEISTFNEAAKSFESKISGYQETLTELTEEVGGKTDNRVEKWKTDNIVKRWETLETDIQKFAKDTDDAVKKLAQENDIAKKQVGFNSEKLSFKQNSSLRKSEVVKPGISLVNGNQGKELLVALFDLDSQITMQKGALENIEKGILATNINITKYDGWINSSNRSNDQLTAWENSKNNATQELNRLNDSKATGDTNLNDLKKQRVNLLQKSKSLTIQKL